MKKLIITTVVVATAYVTAQAQGLVHFNNSNSTLISTNAVSGGSALGVAPAASSFYYALFAAATGTTVGGSTAAVMPNGVENGTYVFNAANAGSWTQVAFGTNTATAGRLAGNAQDGAANTTLPAGFAAGTQYSFVVVGWSANLGSSIAQLQNALTGGALGWLGQSVVGLITPGNGTSIPSSAIFGGAAPFIQGWTLGQTVAIPEPGTLALAALGGAALLMFRRKK